MTIKEIVIKTIDKLPDDEVYDDIIHALYIKAKFINGFKQIKEGNGISHSEAKKRFSKWIK